MANAGIKKVFVTPLDSVSESDKEGLGVIRFEGGNIYKYVKYVEGTGTLDVADGDVVFYNDYENNEVTADISDTNNIGAGVVQAAVTETDRYIWIKIKGIDTLNTDVVAGANGNALTAVGSNDKTLDVSAAATDAVVAYLLDDSAGSQKILCDFPF